MKTQGEGGGRRKKERGGEREIGTEEERARADWAARNWWREKTIRGVGLKWGKKQQLLQLGRSFFCFVLFLWSWTVSHTCFCWVCDELHPSTPSPLPLLWWSSSRLYLLQYLALWILHACLPTRVLWTGIEKWLFEKSLWWWAQFVSNAKKFVWTLRNVGLRWCRGLSWEGCCLPVWLFQSFSACLYASVMLTYFKNHLFVLKWEYYLLFVLYCSSAQCVFGKGILIIKKKHLFIYFSFGRSDDRIISRHCYRKQLIQAQIFSNSCKMIAIDGLDFAQLFVINICISKLFIYHLHLVEQNIIEKPVLIMFILLLWKNFKYFRK